METYIGQYNVVLNIKPFIFKSNNFAVYSLSCTEIEVLLSDWDSQIWDFKNQGKKKSERKNYYHPTAIGRNKVPAPIREYLKCKKSINRNLLYHGIGRDEIGKKALAQNNRVSAYDPFHPLVEVRELHRDKYDEIHSHYTLNVIDKAEGKTVLKEILSLLKPLGRAIISVRRDL